MKWSPGGESQDIEDRRDQSGGGGGGFQFGGMHLGIGGALVLLILSFVFKTNLPNELIPINPLGMTVTYFREDQAFK